MDQENNNKKLDNKLNEETNETENSFIIEKESIFGEDADEKSENKDDNAKENKDIDTELDETDNKDVAIEKDINNNEAKEIQEKDIIDKKDKTEEFETVPNEPSFEEVEEKTKKKRTGSYFDGSLIELIGYHLLSGIITAFTLGFGRPWAECLVMGYKINHTVYNGKRLKFEGKGANYFVQKFKWVIFTILTLGIYAFWIPINKIKWQTKNIHFEDEEFITDNNYFDGKLIQLIGINFLSWFLICVSFGILYPFVHCMKIRWTTKHTIINRKKLRFNGNALDLFVHYLLWLFLTIITFGIYGLWLSINYMKWQTKNTHIKIKDEVIEKKSNKEMIISVAIVCIVFIVGMFIVGRLLANFRTVPNTEAEANIRTVIANAENEFTNKQYTDDEVDKWKSSDKAIPINSIKKLNLDSLNTFDKNGGFGIFTYDSYYSRYDETTNTTNRQIELVLKYKNMVCLTSMNTNPTININNQVECKTFSEYINIAKLFFQINPITSKNKTNNIDLRNESINIYNNERNNYDY